MKEGARRDLYIEAGDLLLDAYNENNISPDEFIDIYLEDSNISDKYKKEFEINMKEALEPSENKDSVDGVFTVFTEFYGSEYSQDDVEALRDVLILRRKLN